MRFPLKGIFFSAVLGTALFVAPAHSQTTSCDLDLRVMNAEGVGKIEGATAVLTDPKTGTSQNSVEKNGFLHFTGLQQDRQYQIVLTRIGYSRTVEENHTVICAPLFDGAVRSFAYLKKGNPKQTYYPEKAGSDHETRIGREDNIPAKGMPGVKGAVAPLSSSSDNSEESDTPTQVRTGSDDKEAPAENGRNIPKIVSKGVINGSAIYLAKPEYSAAARATGASGVVSVQVTIDEEGNVISAVATSGHPLLKAASADAAKASRFKPTLLEGVPVKVSGIIVYNFQ
jgi:TonB family protein